MDKESNKQLTEILKQISGKGSSRNIEDFDSGLLNNLFEDISGTPRDRFDKITERLIKVATRIEKQYINQDEKPSILNDIDKFLRETELPQITPEVEDYQQREGRMITIHRDDSKTKGTCVIEAYDKTIDRITEEQYFKLINKARILLYKATAVLDDKIIKWHDKKELKLTIPSIGEVKVQ